jgi:hypothetical protein
MCNCEEKRIYKCNCGGVFENDTALRKHIDASNDWPELEKLIAAGNHEAYRLRLHGNVSYTRPYLPEELKKEAAEFDRLQDYAREHPRYAGRWG